MNDLKDPRPWGMEVNTFCMLMHLSQLSSVVMPGLGLILPIIMWATNKDGSTIVDNHGKRILNWTISALIYSAVSGMLMLVFVGIIGFIAIIICNLIFAIIGAVKANSGVAWGYPLSIKFFKIDEQVSPEDLQA